MAYLAPFSK